jgi:hypothetical protein
VIGIAIVDILNIIDIIDYQHYWVQFSRIRKERQARDTFGKTPRYSSTSSIDIFFVDVVVLGA